MSILRRINVWWAGSSNKLYSYQYNMPYRLRSEIAKSVIGKQAALTSYYGDEMDIDELVPESSRNASMFRKICRRYSVFWDSSKASERCIIFQDCPLSAIYLSTTKKSNKSVQESSSWESIFKHFRLIGVTQQFSQTWTVESSICSMRASE